eukprot:5118710-Pleurochrysis_carterae.AAC.1
MTKHRPSLHRIAVLDTMRTEVGTYSRRGRTSASYAFGKRRRKLGAAERGFERGRKRLGRAAASGRTSARRRGLCCGRRRCAPLWFAGLLAVLEVVLEGVA